MKEKQGYPFCALVGQEEMKRAETCLHCGACVKKCPYELDTPALLEKNVEDYKKVLSGERSV